MNNPLAFAGLLAGILLPVAAPAQEFVAIDNGGAMYAFDPVTGCSTGLAAVIPNLVEINAMAKRPSDGHLFVAGAWNPGVPCELIEIDPATWTEIGRQLITGPPGNSFSIRGMAFDSAGTLFLSNWNDAVTACDLWTCDESTGVASYVGWMWTGSIQALAWDDVNGRLVGWSPFTASAISGLVHIDPVTAVMVDPNPLNVTSSVWEVQGLGYDDSGRLMSIGQYYMKEIDPLTGDALWTSACYNGGFLRGIEYIAPPSFSLAMTGACPGPMTIELTNGTPNDRAAIAWSFTNSGFSVPGGPCAGTTVDLGAPATVLGVYNLDAQGGFVLGPVNVPAGACGNIWVQALDLGNCAVTAPVQP